MEATKLPSQDIEGLSSLAATVMILIQRKNELEKENAQLKQALEISRKLQEKPRLYPPDADPYFGDEGEG